MLLGWECGWLGGAHGWLGGVCGWLGGVHGWHKQAANKSWNFLLHVGKQLFFLKLHTLEICVSEERKKILCICEVSGAEINWTTQEKDTELAGGAFHQVPH